MELYTSLSQRVLDLEKTMTSQAAEITELKKRVKKLEGKRKSKPPGMKRLFKICRSTQVIFSEDEGLGDQEDASKQGRKIADIDADAEVTLVDETQGSATTTSIDELTLAQTLIEIKAAKPKARGVIVQELSEFTTTTSPSQPSQLPQAKDKGKAKMVEPEKPLKKKDQIIQREEVVNIAKWDNLQAMMDADYELAARLQTEEQRELTIEEKSRFFIELMNKRKNYFTRHRAEEQRRKPPTKA
ncbi:hypothetical protein Tco_1574669 [Tanacetum coccineum]